MGTLYIVPTPIGNLEDITLRALRVLREVRLIAAEDTRTTQVLLRHYEIATPLTSYHEHNKLSKLDRIFEALSAGDVALVSDAGTPGISDPGYELIGAVIAAGWRVEPLPGPSALLPALVGSGLPSDQFVYIGFLPRKDKALRAVLDSLRAETRTVIAYESPKRLLDTLALVEEILPERALCVARELSKIYEEFVRGGASEIRAHFETQPLKGEIVLLIGGAPAMETVWAEEDVLDALDELLNEGESLSRAAKNVAVRSGWPRREVYALKTNPGKNSQSP
jgi:16S rRNA (cytidine1402-2'-O)-methyltransferase